MGRLTPRIPPKQEEVPVVERADVQFDAESDDVESDETLEEAEAEIGLSGWVDPDTGDLGESWTPRLEDH